MFSRKELNLNKGEKDEKRLLFTKQKKKFESNMHSDWLMGTMVAKYISQG